MVTETNLADLAGTKPPHRRGASYTRREKAEEDAASCSDDEEAENEAQEVPTTEQAVWGVGSA